MSVLSRKLAEKRKKREKIFFKELRRRTYKILYSPPPKVEVPKKEEKVKVELPEIDIEYKALLKQITALRTEIENIDYQLKMMGEEYKKTKDQALKIRILDLHSQREDLVEQHNLLVREFKKYKEKITRTIIFTTVETEEQQAPRKLEVHITLTGDKEDVTEKVLKDLMDLFLESNRNLKPLRWEMKEGEEYGLTEWMVTHSKDEKIYVHLRYIDIDYPHNSWKDTEKGTTLKRIEQAVATMAVF